MFRKSPGPKATRISVDLGGHHIRIAHETDGLILDEPSVGLLDMQHRTGGSNAMSKFGRDAITAAAESSSSRLIRVLQSDDRNPLGYTSQMLRHYFSALRRGGMLGKAPVVLLNIPPGISQLLTDDLKHACFTAGASRVHLVDNAIACAVGAGLSVEDSHPQMLLDLGARAARLYAMQFNEIVAAYSLPFGGDMLDDAMARGIRERYGLYVSKPQAQQAKHLVGRAMTSSLGQQLRNSCQMRGLQIAENDYANFTLTTEVACELLQPAMQRASEALSAAVQALPYQFRNPQQNVAIIITGGGSQLAQIDQLVMEAGNCPVQIASNPAALAVSGGAVLLSRIHGTSRASDPA